MAGRHTHIMYYVVPLNFTLGAHMAADPTPGLKLPCYAEDVHTYNDLGFVSSL